MLSSALIILITTSFAQSYNWPAQTIETVNLNLNPQQKKITIAVIDTGIDTYHPDLKSNLWTNSGEQGIDTMGRNKESNNIDDDDNGFVDDVHGWNFSANNSNLSDNVGHGTHISGIIAGNGKNFKGIAPVAQLMTLKYYDPQNKKADTVTATIQAIQYAIKMKADIINYSAGGSTPSPQEKQAIEKAQQAGILFVAAAGNESSNADFLKFYPAAYQLDNILSVAATDQQNQLLSSSNYGAKSVLIAAPGKSIFSCAPGGGYATLTGTSQATAFVSGVAALILEQSKYKLSPQETIQQITSTGKAYTQLNLKTKSQSVLNAYQSLSMASAQKSLLGFKQKRKISSESRFFYESSASLSVFSVP